VGVSGVWVGEEEPLPGCGQGLGQGAHARAFSLREEPACALHRASTWPRLTMLAPCANSALSFWTPRLYPPTLSCTPRIPPPAFLDTHCHNSLQVRRPGGPLCRPLCALHPRLPLSVTHSVSFLTHPPPTKQVRQPRRPLCRPLCALPWWRSQRLWCA
jgi:hypothetical protein